MNSLKEQTLEPVALQDTEAELSALARWHELEKKPPPRPGWLWGWVRALAPSQCALVKEAEPDWDPQAHARWQRGSF